MPCSCAARPRARREPVRAAAAPSSVVHRIVRDAPEWHCRQPARLYAACAGPFCHARPGGTGRPTGQETRPEPVACRYSAVGTAVPCGDTGSCLDAPATEFSWHSKSMSPWSSAGGWVPTHRDTAGRGSGVPKRSAGNHVARGGSRVASSRQAQRGRSGRHRAPAREWLRHESRGTRVMHAYADDVDVAEWSGARSGAPPVLRARILTLPHHRRT